jgi:hypothetical protein
MKTLDETDIALADYVARFGQWTGAGAPKRNETPSGLLREAMRFAETVKGLRVALEEEQVEFAEGFQEEYEAEILEKFWSDELTADSIVSLWGDQSVLRALGESEATPGTFPKKHASEGDEDYATRFNLWVGTNKNTWFSRSRLMAWEDISSRGDSAWILSLKECGGISLSVATMLSELNNIWPTSSGKKISTDDRKLQDRIRSLLGKLEPISWRIDGASYLCVALKRGKAKNADQKLLTCSEVLNHFQKVR